VDRRRARDLMDLGDEKMAKGDVEGALVAYYAADKIVRVPTSGIEVGRAQLALGLWVEARDTWVRVALYPKKAGEPKPFTQARQAAERLAMELGPRIPTLIVLLDRPAPKGLAVWLDDRLLSSEELGVALLVNPGKHQLRTSAPGYTPTAVDVELAEGAERRATLTFTAKPPPSRAKKNARPPEPWLSARPGHSPALMWTGFSVALSGTVVGAATGIWAIERAALAQEQCTGTACPESAARDIEQARLAGTVSTIAFVLGGAGLVLGTWQAITRGPARAQAELPARAIAAYPHPSGVRVVFRGTFQ
jgi:hypothetical protein